MSRKAVQSIGASLVVMWIGWVSYTLNQVSQDLARIKERLGMNGHEAVAAAAPAGRVPARAMAAAR